MIRLDVGLTSGTAFTSKLTNAKAVEAYGSVQEALADLHTLAKNLTDEGTAANLTTKFQMLLADGETVYLRPSHIVYAKVTEVMEAR